MAARIAVPTRIRLAAIACVVLFGLLVAQFWHPVYGFTAFFQLDASNDNVKLAAFRELPVYVYRDTGGYDGLYYAQIALDPTLRNPALKSATDSLSYRARRILPSGIAWIMGGGKPARVVSAYSMLNLAAWVVLAYLLWRLIAVTDWQGFAAWAGVLFSAGALCSVRLALTDLTAATLIVAAMVAAEQYRKYSAVVGIAMAALARETAFLGVAGLVKPPWFSAKNAIRVAAAGLPLALWLLYVRHTVGEANAGWGNFTWPAVGWFEKLQAAFMAPFHMRDHVLAWTTLLTTLAIGIQAFYVIRHPRPEDRWWRIGAAFTILMLTLGTAVWEGFPGAAARVLLPLNVAFNVLAHRFRANLTWLLLGNLTVFSGLLTMCDVPKWDNELASDRKGAHAVIIRAGDGWFGLEQSSRHQWLWARDHGTFRIEIWPRSGTHVRFSFAMRSLAPRTVTLRTGSTVLLRQEIGLDRRTCQVEVALKGETAALRFETDAPLVRENNSPDARELGFALYDLRVEAMDH